MRDAAPAVDIIHAPARVLQRAPARLDVLQSATGLALALFMLVHTLFAATILLGVDAMATLARALEGYYLFGRSTPIIVTAFTLVIFATFVVHAVLAMRKSPGCYEQFVRFRRALAELQHPDTNLWWLQVVTGYVIMFLATVHMYIVLANPHELGPIQSAEQVWSGHMWPLYLVLLPATELHVGVGLYRLAMKWGWFQGRRPEVARRRLKKAMWALIAVYITLGLASLSAYAWLGFERAHSSNALRSTRSPASICCNSIAP